MKFLLYLFCILIFFPSSCSAIEEVILNIDDNNAPEPKAEKSLMKMINLHCMKNTGYQG